MDLRATPNLVHLNDTGSGRRMLHLEPALGHRVVALSGSVWITQAGSPEDYVLRAGESLTLDSPGMAVVTSFGPADVEVVAPTDANAQPWPPAISAAVVEEHQRRARELRAQAVHEMLTAAADRIRGFARGLMSIGSHVRAQGAPGHEFRAPARL